MDNFSRIQPAPAGLPVYLSSFHHMVFFLRGGVLFFSPLFLLCPSVLATTSKRNGSREAASSFFRDSSHQIIATGAVNSTRRPLGDPPSVNFHCLKSVDLCVCICVCPSVWTEKRHHGEIKGRSARAPDHLKVDLRLDKK